MTVREAKRTVFVTDDGEEFTTKQKALEHEAEERIDKWLAEYECYGSIEDIHELRAGITRNADLIVEMLEPFRSKENETHS